MYRAKDKRDKKSYILLFTCSLTRVIHLELLPDQTKEEFMRALKRLISRRGCPETIYSDNAKTFVAASKWIKRNNKTEILHHFLNTKISSGNSIWVEYLGGVGSLNGRLVLWKMHYIKQFENQLEWHELAEILTDIETTLIDLWTAWKKTLSFLI